MNDDIFIIA